MTLAYFMQTAGSEVFGERDVVVIDEAHGLAEWAEMHATIELSPATVPVWDACRPPDIEELVDVEPYAERLLDTCSRRQEELRGRVELTETEAEERDQLAELVRDLGWFLEDLQDSESPTAWVVDQSDRGTREDPRGGAISIKPLDPARYLHHTVWNRGRKFALLSATMLDKTAFCRSAGLDPDAVALVDVPHTFPVENRPLYDVTRGKMTYEHRDETLPEIARVVVRLMAVHADEKGLIHAHSYDIAERLRELLAEFGVGNRVRGHDSDNRDAALSGWKQSNDPEVFVSVKMEEALDLEGELCRWQLLCKAPYPNTSDSRVARRLEDDQWGWYYRTALRTVIQACGRVVRSPDDHGATYLADRSLLDLFERARNDMPPWFEAQVDRLSDPDLPPFDPERAVDDSGETERRRRSTAGGSERIEEHPLSDVWGDE
jgi:Rad3-related DNA helicase